MAAKIGRSRAARWCYLLSVTQILNLQMLLRTVAEDDLLNYIDASGGTKGSLV